MKNNNMKLKLKLIMLGDTCVGKTSIVKRKQENSFSNLYNSTIGVDFFSFEEKIDNYNIRVNLWDTGGQERFKNIIKAYYRDVSGVLLMYDVNNKNSFNNLKHWIKDLKENKINNYVIIVGCKNDTKNRIIDYNDAYTFAKDNNYLYDECSSKDNVNIDSIFTILINKIKDDIVNNIIIPNGGNGITLQLFKSYPENKPCCNLL